ncbi:MAG: ABC transporter ATP-binding protein [Candidatus Altiarchaeota archaeon]
MSLKNTKSAGQPIIDLQDVWKIYQMGEVEVPALRGLTLSIYPQEFLAVMGPSGSGKSTALNMIGCLDVPTRGDILLSGQNIAHLSESDLAQIRGKKIGFIFQQFNLMPSLTAQENVALPMIFQGYSAIEREDRSKHLLEIVGLGDRMHHRPAELSGGQQQRVAIARSLSNDPEVILADEPTGNLDSKSSSEIMDMLQELHEKEDKTIIMVTHDPEVGKRAKRLVQLRDGTCTTC